MAEPFLAEIRIFSFGFPPKSWALCDGQLLPINQNQALFALLGTNYGGDGRVNFGLPNLQGNVPLHMGGGFVIGQRGGEQGHTLTVSELPQHTHPVKVNTGGGSQLSPANGYWAADPNGNATFGTVRNTSLSPLATQATGGGQAHLNMMPFLTLNFCIALQGIFPTQN